MAPEQALGEHAGPASDQYSLGIVLYQMVTGRAPFEEETPVKLLMQHIQTPPPPPRTLRPELPEPAQAAILRALAKRPEDRFASAGALARAFTVGLEGRWTEGLGPTSAAISPRTPPTIQAVPPPTIIATPPPYASPYSMATPYPQVGVPYPVLTVRRRGFAAGWMVAAAILVLAAIVAGLGLVNAANKGSASGGTTPNDGKQAGAIASATPTPKPTFQLNRLYTYTSVIGHSNTTSLTNSDVNVTLVSIAFDTSNSVSTLVVSFHDYDSAKSADFLFQSLANVYLIDNANRRYPAVVATPNELTFGPGQDATVSVVFPLIGPSVTSLSLFFNTDHSALDTPCVSLSPSGATSGCAAP